ncbi:MAG: hypothetical protein A2148_06090 [Chloroflexi bacterium RBG_16_68_14]|nr:MAG: hypothetical protein A2148_06090 [Chloroflexi bacterium RBG_16_68_14]
MTVPQQEKGHRWFAALYDRIGGRAEQHFGKTVRPRLMGEVRGRVLEIGAGTGASFAHYPPEAQVVATEPDPFMLERARRRLAELGASHIELHQAPAEQLPFENASFDHVVSSLVLCTVPDLPRALAEARRILKPEGTFRFWEHVRNDESRFWGGVQDVITPVWRWVGAGCHPNRRTQQAIEEAGFRIEWVERVRLAPGTPGIYGVARPG